MSTLQKLHRVLRNEPFWRDLTDAIDEELSLFQQDRVSAKRNFFEWRTLDKSNFYDPSKYSSFDNYQDFLVNRRGWSPWSELFFKRIVPTVRFNLPTSGAVTDLINEGDFGPVTKGGDGTLVGATVTGSLAVTVPSTVEFTGTQSIVLSSDYDFSLLQTTVIVDFAPTLVTSNRMGLIGKTENGYLFLNSDGLGYVASSGSVVSVAWLTPLDLGTLYRVAVRLRSSTLTVFLNGIEQGSVRCPDSWPIPGDASVDITGNTTVTLPVSPSFLAPWIGGDPGTGADGLTGHLGRITLYDIALSNEDILGDYEGQDLSLPAWRLERSWSLRFMKAEAKGFGFRVEYRGSAPFYRWVFNKAQLEGRAYQLYRDPAVDLFIRSVTLPNEAAFSGLTNPVPEPYYPGSEAFGARFHLDSPDTTPGLDNTLGWTLDESILGKNVLPSKHFALEKILGRGRDDLDGVTPAVIASDDWKQALFSQEELDYLLYEARFGHASVETPHIGVLLPLVVKRTDVAPRYDLFTRTSVKTAAAFPVSGWTTALFKKIKVYAGNISSVTPLWSRNVSVNELDVVASGIFANLMIPALSVGPTPVSGVSGQTSYTFSLTAAPVYPGTVFISFIDTLTGTRMTLRDDGQGRLYYTHIVPDINHYSGTINYATGSVTFLTFISSLPKFIPGWNGPTSVTFNVGTGQPIDVNHKTKALVKLDKIELWDDTQWLVQINLETPLVFEKPSNHLSLNLTIQT